MKIVLNNEERKSFERFVVECTASYKSALESIDSNDARIVGKSEAEIILMMVKELGVDSVVDILKETQEETTYRVSPDILVAYNEYMAASMKVLRPYTDTLTLICNENDDKIKYLVSKMPRMTVPIVNNVIKGLFSMVGLEKMYVDLFDLYTRFTSDERGYSSMKKLVKQFSDKVEANKIMTDYLNK